jgi:hypothetical protein
MSEQPGNIFTPTFDQPNASQTKYNSSAITELSTEDNSELLKLTILFILLVIGIIIIYNFWKLYAYACEDVELPECARYNQTSSLQEESKLSETHNSTGRENFFPLENGSIDESTHRSKTRQPVVNGHVGIIEHQRKKNNVFVPYNSSKESHDNKNKQQKDKKNEIIANREKDYREPDHDDGHENNFDDKTSERIKIKFAVYHMDGCHHCGIIMKSNKGKSLFEKLFSIYADNKNVEIIDYKYGRDAEASKYNSFPTIILTIDNLGVEKEYGGPRTVEAMSKYIEAWIKKANKMVQNE